MKTFASLLLLLIIICTSASAAVVQNLYQGTVPINNTSQKGEQQAINKALEQVLIKVSGNPYIMTIPKIQSAIANSDYILESYSFSKDNEQPILSAKFSEKAIKQRTVVHAQ